MSRRAETPPSADLRSSASCRSLRSTQMEKGVLLVRQLGDGAEREHPVALQPIADPGGCPPERSPPSCTRRNKDSDVALMVPTPLEASWIGPPNRRYVAVRSMTATSAPALRRAIAANSPPSPPPATSTRRGASVETASGTDSADNFVSDSQPGAAARMRRWTRGDRCVSKRRAARRAAYRARVARAALGRVGAMYAELRRAAAAGAADEREAALARVGEQLDDAIEQGVQGASCLMCCSPRSCSAAP